jgi:hypothetical protein
MSRVSVSERDVSDQDVEGTQQNEIVREGDEENSRKNESCSEDNFIKMNQQLKASVGRFSSLSPDILKWQEEQARETGVMIDDQERPLVAPGIVVFVLNPRGNLKGIC